MDNVCNYLTGVDIFCMILFYVLGTWKLFELTNKYGDKTANWIINKVEETSRRKR